MIYLKFVVAAIAAGLLAFTSTLNAFAAKEFSSGNQRVQSGRSFWQEAKVTVNDDGKLIAFITTETKEAVAGFTGQMIFVLRDHARNIIGVFSSDGYGVDGTTVPFSSKSQRKDTWTTQLTPEQTKALKDIEFIASRNGRSSSDRAKQLAKQVIDVAKYVYAEAQSATK